MDTISPLLRAWASRLRAMACLGKPGFSPTSQLSPAPSESLRVLDRDQRPTIRVVCIDAPEMAQSPYGQKAREALQDLLPIGSTVSLKIQTKDRNGGTVAEVFTQNGANAGLTLVQQGHAFAYRQYLQPCDQWAYLDRKKLAERYRLGVWRLSGGIECPWDFRGARRGLQGQPVARPQRPVNTRSSMMDLGPTPPGGGIAGLWRLGSMPSSCCIKGIPIWMATVKVRRVRI